MSMPDDRFWRMRRHMIDRRASECIAKIGSDPWVLRRVAVSVIDTEIGQSIIVPHLDWPAGFR